MKKIIILLMAMMSFVQYGFCISDTFEIELDDRKWEAMYPMLPHHDVIFLVPENSENEFICITEFFDKVDFGTGRESCLQIFMPDQDAFLHTEKVSMKRRTYYVWYHCPTSSITEEQKAKWAERFKDGYICDPAKTVTINKDGAFMGGKALTKEWKYMKVAHPTENYTIDLPEGFQVYSSNQLIVKDPRIDYDRSAIGKFSMQAKRSDRALRIQLCVIPPDLCWKFFNKVMRGEAFQKVHKNARYMDHYAHETSKKIQCWYTRVIEHDGSEDIEIFFQGKCKIYALDFTFKHKNYDDLIEVITHVIDSFEEYDSKTMKNIRHQCVIPALGIIE